MGKNLLLKIFNITEKQQQLFIVNPSDGSRKKLTDIDATVQNISWWILKNHCL